MYYKLQPHPGSSFFGLEMRTSLRRTCIALFGCTSSSSSCAHSMGRRRRPKGWASIGARGIHSSYHSVRYYSEVLRSTIGKVSHKGCPSCLPRQKAPPFHRPSPNNTAAAAATITSFQDRRTHWRSSRQCDHHVVSRRGAAGGGRDELLEAAADIGFRRCS